jgi:DNA replication and repair protein RecF
LRAVAVRGTNFRCYRQLELELDPGLVAVVGPNGAGKTALVEMLHFAALGYSPRTSNEARMVTFGEDFLRTELEAETASGATTVTLGYRPHEPKRLVVDGAAERSVERLLERFPVLVFTPDRLRLVQGAPAMRRSYIDRVLTRLWPVLAAASGEYARRLAQRNHLLKRIRARAAEPSALEPWDRLLVEAGAALMAARSRLCSRLAVPLTTRLTELGGIPGDPPLRYLPSVEGDAEAFAAVLAARRGKDVDRAATGAGPHLDDFGLVDDGRDLRHYGSQGEQRRALLALILAEADLLTEERREQPLLLLDDVTSELDGERRRRLLAAVRAFPQTVVTTADEADLADAGELTLLRVEAGTVTR